MIESVICDPNFEGLVLGCIEADFCNQILVGKLSPRSTKCTPLHRSRISIFSQNVAKILTKFVDILLIFADFAKMLLHFDEISPEFQQNLPSRASRPKS